jgi:hypothetical protein
MAIYELRTYNAIVGKMSELVSLYKNEGWPALSTHPPSWWVTSRAMWAR